MNGEEREQVASQGARKNEVKGCAKRDGRTSNMKKIKKKMSTVEKKAKKEPAHKPMTRRGTRKFPRKEKSARKVIRVPSRLKMPPTA